MIHSMLLSSAGLERVTDWVRSHNTDLRIIHVLFEPNWDRYVTLVECTEREATYLSLLEH